MQKTAAFGSPRVYFGTGKRYMGFSVSLLAAFCLSRVYYARFFFRQVDLSLRQMGSCMIAHNVLMMLALRPGGAC